MMSDLISKKELWRRYGISCLWRTAPLKADGPDPGELVSAARLTPSGQETAFCHEAKIICRVERILESGARVAR